MALRVYPDGVEVDVLRTAVESDEFPVTDETEPSFARWMSGILTRRGLSQEAGARELGVSVRTMSRWIAGATEPRLRDLRRIRDVFGEIPLNYGRRRLGGACAHDPCQDRIRPGRARLPVPQPVPRVVTCSANWLRKVGSKIRSGSTFRRPIKDVLSLARGASFWGTFGLCGGMSWAALDLFFEEQAVPAESAPPAEGTELFSGLVGRQADSLAKTQLFQRVLTWQLLPDSTQWWRFWLDNIGKLVQQKEWPQLRTGLEAGTAPVALFDQIGRDLRVRQQPPGGCHRVRNQPRRARHRRPLRPQPSGLRPEVVIPSGGCIQPYRRPSKLRRAGARVLRLAPPVALDRLEPGPAAGPPSNTSTKSPAHHVVFGLLRSGS